MKDLEEVNCEIRRVIDIQSLVASRLKNTDCNDCGSQGRSQSLDCTYNPPGGFLNDMKYAWLSNGPYLVVLNVKTGENISSWTFCEKISCVAQFPAQPGQLPLLLVGLDNDASKVKDSVGLLCIFDCTTSRVLRAIRMPAGVEQVCVISGGAEWEEFNEKRPDSILSKTDGTACVVLCNLYHIMVDLQRSQWEAPDSYPIMDEASPAETDFSMAISSHTRHLSSATKHTAYNLLNDRIEHHLRFSREEFEMSTLYEEKLTSAVISSTKIGCLISGCLGRVIIWQNDGSVGWISPLVDGSMAVTHLALLEPTDDPRPYCYLWVVYQDETLKMAPLLRMYALLFQRKYSDKGTNLYFNLEAEPSLKFEFQLEEEEKIINLSSIERESNSDHTDSVNKRGEDNLLFIASNEKTLLFDLNQWYKEQMPRTINECQNPNSIMASYRTRSNPPCTPRTLISSDYVPNTLREFPNNSPHSPEELFYPNSLSLEWIELSANQLTFWSTRGIQANVLREIAIAGPIILLDPAETFHKCLSVGLIPFNTEVGFESDQIAQREMLLSLCLEQRWASFLVKCVKEWSDGSASYLYPTFLKWGVQRAASIKMIADRLCIPLFDQSGSSIGEAEIRTLRFCSQQLECLSNVVAKLPFESSDLIKQQKALKRISTYLQVLLWFYDVGMLPETQEMDENALPISLTLKIPYPVERLTALYKEKREQLRNTAVDHDVKEESLFIDEMITRECSVLRSQWEKESGGISTNGYYPPPSLQSLLRSYLTDCDQTEVNDIEYKHQITIYLLMDLAMLLQGSYPSVDQLIKYPSAFKMCPSLIKLTQAFWLLDHEDYQGFLEMMTGQLVSDFDVKDWHHKLVLRTLVRNNQHKLALVYLRIRKPPLSSIEDQKTVISLSVEYGLVQSAFHRRPPSHYSQLLICFFQACKTYGKLSDILHLTLDTEEEEVFVKFLEHENSGDMRLLYYLQRCRYSEANNGHFLGMQKNCIPKLIQPAALAMLNACNATLPEVTKHFTLNSNKSNLDADVNCRYPRPMSHRKSCKKSVGMYESVIKKAKETYVRGEKSQIPFVTAPCTSLTFSNNHANTNCVLFPALAQKSRCKRTLDQMQEDENNSVDVPDTSKRRKLSDMNESANKSGITEWGLNSVLDTPLIKRKINIADGQDTPPETPHSILKIRQLITSTSSPNVTVSTNDSIKTPLFEKDKISRQIRFNVEQSSKDTTREEGMDEEGESNSKSTSASKSASDESEDVFFSPNVSNKSCSESTVLSDSSFSCKDAYHPRPRPSLRRSYIRKSDEATLTPAKNSSKPISIGHSSMSVSPSNSLNQCENNSLSSTDIDRYTSSTTSLSITRHRNSLQSDSIHSSTILSSDTSFEAHLPTRRVGISPRSRFSKQQSFTCDKTSRSFERNCLNNGELTMEVDNVEMKTSYSSSESATPEGIKGTSKTSTQESLRLSDVTTTEQFFEGQDKEESLRSIRSLESNLSEGHSSEKEEISEVHSNVSIQTQKEDHRESIHEEYDSKNLMYTEGCRVVQEDKHIDDIDVEDDKFNNGNFSDEYEHELRLSSTEEDDTTNDAFRSLSNSLEPNRDNTFAPFVRISETDKKICESYHRQSTDATAVDITDDESTNDEVLLEKHEFSKRMSAYYNITDDESNSSTIVNKESQTEKFANVIGITDRVKTSVDKNTVNQNTSSLIKSTVMHNVIETHEQTLVRETRSRRASSVAKDTMVIPQVDADSGNIAAGKLQIVSSLTKDIVTSEKKTVKPNRSDSTSSLDSIPVKRSQTRGSTIIMKKELANDEVEDKGGTPVRRSSRRIASAQKDLVEPMKTSSRKERASSVSSIVSEEDKVSTPKKSVRNRRPSSVLKGQITIPGKLPAESAVETMDISEIHPARKRASSVPKETVVRTGRMKRSSSVVNDVIPEETSQSLVPKRGKRASKVSEEHGNVVDDVIGQNNSELLVLPKKGRKISKTAEQMNKILEETDTEKVVELPAITKRGRKPIKAAEEAISDEASESIAKTRKGRKTTDKSVKEANVLANDVTQKPIESSTSSRRGRRVTTNKLVENVPNSPATNTRSRRSSIQSIPGELEEILSVPSTIRNVKEATKNIRRTRRAASVDLPVTEVPKKSRSIRTGSITEDLIAEEPDKNEELESSNIESEKRSARRKVAVINTTGEELTTSKTRRKRVPFTKGTESENQFLFSHPVKTEDHPVDKEALSEVPKYVFSPPQTRSKHVTTDQPRRTIVFIPVTEDDMKEETDVQKTSKSSQSASYTGCTVNRVESRFKTKFIIPKLPSKSTSD